MIENSLKTGNVVRGPALPETEPLWYMSQSKQHRHLLKHPVITSFLWFKWQKIRKYFNRNLRFTLLFVFLMTWYIFKLFGAKSDKDDTNFELSWYLSFIVFFTIMMFFVVKDWVIDIKNYQRDKSILNSADIQENRATMCMKIFFANWVEAVFISIGVVMLIFGGASLVPVLACLLVMLLIREMMQMAVSLKRYLSSCENWMELGILTLSVVLLVPGITGYLY